MTTRASTPRLLDIRSATHVVFDPAMLERLSKLGAVRVVCACDALIVGPSRRDAAEHARAREAWWGSPDEFDRLHAPDFRWTPPIVVWTSASLLDKLNLWRTCSWLRHLHISPRDVLIIELGPTPWKGDAPPPRFRCSEPLDHHPDEVLLQRAERARAWPPARFDRAVSLWEKYVDANPLRFARMCARGVPRFPELAPIWALLTAFFPRRTPEGTLRLSRFDELLLTLLSGEWQTPAALFVHPSQPRELRELLSCTGDLFIPRRLDDWAGHGPAPAVERAAGPKPDRSMVSFVYRLTERGMRLRAEGLAQLADAPRLPVAGTEAYAPSSPWVLQEDGKLVRL